MLHVKLLKYLLSYVMSGLDVSCKNILKIDLFFVVGGSKLVFFMGQILDYIIAFILRRREYYLSIYYIYIKFIENNPIYTLILSKI